MLRRAMLGMAMMCVVGSVCAGEAAGFPAMRQPMRGRTGQHYRVTLRARGQTIEIIRFTIKLACRDGSTLIDEESGFQRISLRRGNRFLGDQFGSTDEVLIGGRLRGHTAHGSVRVTDRLGNGVRCDSHWVRFQARAKG